MLTSPKFLWPAVDHNIFHQSRIGNNISRKLVSLTEQTSTKREVENPSALCKRQFSGETVSRRSIFVNSLEILRYNVKSTLLNDFIIWATMFGQVMSDGVLS